MVLLNRLFGLGRWPGMLVFALLAVRAVPVRGQALVASAYHSRATDSLQAALRNPAMPDSQRVLTVFSLQQEYYMNDAAASMRLARQALAMARQKHFVRGELMVLSALARAATDQQDLPQAERWAEQLQRRVAQAPPTLQRFRIVALQTFANVAVEQSDFARAARYLRQAAALLPLVANRPDSELPVITYFGLSEIYSYWAADTPHPPDSLVRTARHYTIRLEQLAQARHRPDMLAKAYSLLGRLSGPSNPDSAVYYFGQATRLYQQLGLRSYEASTRQEWAEVELHQRHYQVAIGQARQALALARAVQSATKQVAAADVLAEALAATGQPAEAYRQARRARLLHDSVSQLNNHTELQAVQVRFDTQRKENQIKELTQQQTMQQAQARQQHQRLWFLAIGLALAALAAGVVGILAWRLRRSRALLAAQNQELTQTRAAQDRLYALVAHDLRSPVLAFMGLADLLHHYVQRQDAARLAGLGERIRQASQTLSELLNNLLNWAVSQRGELVPAPRPLRVDELLAEMVGLYQSAATAAEVTLNCDPASNLLVQADPDMTRTILRNLTGNALQATPAGGTVQLRAWLQAGGVRLQVADTGQGLEPDVLNYLAANSPLRVADHHHGVGLGLLLSYSFAQAQGGSLTLANASTGQGAVAILTLPAAAA